MTATQKRYILIKGIPIAALIIYALLSLMCLRMTDGGVSRYVWSIPYTVGLLELIAGEPIRKRLRVSHNWLAAYTRSLGALFATVSFAVAIS